MLRYGLVAIAFASLTGAVAAQQINQGVTPPSWLERPSGEALWENYPAAAVAQRVQGSVILTCLVKLDTHADCIVEEENPRDWGFADAAIAISQTFRMAPAMRNGQALVGGVIRVPMRFQIPLEYDEKRPSGMSEEEWQFWQRLPEPELPVWDDAPSASDVEAAYPVNARQNGVRGRAVLSCRTRRDRRLECEPLLQTPEGQGFGEAALTLSRDFLVSEREREFLTRHRSDPFLLPVNFGSGAEMTPLNVNYDGAGPLEIPVIDLPPPPGVTPALAQRMAGEAVFLCTFYETSPTRCDVERVEPLDWPFAADFATNLSNNLPSSREDMIEAGVLSGDQVRMTVRFRP